MDQDGPGWTKMDQDGPEWTRANQSERERPKAQQRAGWLASCVPSAIKNAFYLLVKNNTRNARAVASRGRVGVGAHMTNGRFVHSHLHASAPSPPATKINRGKGGSAAFEFASEFATTRPAFGFAWMKRRQPQWRAERLGSRITMVID